jgi:hypothetical protein
MDPHSDDSWKPDPGNPDPDDLRSDDGKEHDMEEPYVHCDNRYSLPHKVPSMCKVWIRKLAFRQIMVVAFPPSPES